MGGCFQDIGSGRRVLMMDTLNLVLQSDGDAYRILLVKAAGKYFLHKDLKSFFVLIRLANILYPGHIDGEVISSKIKHMKSAIKWHYQMTGTNDQYTFVCRDQLQFDLYKKNNFGEMSDIILKEIKTTRNSETVANERAKRGENPYEVIAGI